MIVKGQSKKNMDLAVRLIQSGELVVFPTETVYGLGADALNEDAVAKIFKLKGRPHEDPLIVHIAGADQLNQVAELPSGEAGLIVEKLIKRFWPGPLTLVLKRKKNLSKLVTGGLETVAVRVPQNLIALALIRNSKRPLAAPSANKFQSLSPTSARAVESELGKEILILDGGHCDVGVESTVLSLLNGKPVILRPGGISVEKIEYILDMKVSTKVSSAMTKMSPGMMDFHYAPRKPLKVFDVEELQKSATRRKKQTAQTALLCFSRAEKRKFAKAGFKSITVLSPDGRLDEAAHHFFRLLRDLDESGAARIAVLKCPNEDLGVALNDRLKKAEHE